MTFGRVARARTASCAERLARFVPPRADSRGRTKSFEPLEFKNYLLISHKLMCNIVCDY
jgi:hypothetical protein